MRKTVGPLAKGVDLRIDYGLGPAQLLPMKTHHQFKIAKLRKGIKNSQFTSKRAKMKRLSRV